MIFVIVILIVILDQFTKFLVSLNLSLQASQPVIKNIFHLTLIHNKGAAFGIFKNYTGLFILTSALAIIFIYFNLHTKRAEGPSRGMRFALAMVLAGAVGNLIDRVRFGYVIDFLDFRAWPVFNVADSAITIGAVLLGYSLLFGKNPKLLNNQTPIKQTPNNNQ